MVVAKKKTGLMRTATVDCGKLLVLVTLGLCSLTAQNVSDLVARYGPPKAGKYEVLPGFGLTVNYGDGHVPCRLQVAGMESSSTHQGSAEVPKYFASDLADRLVTEFVPAAARKGKPVKSLMQSGCLAFEDQDYENVHVNRVINKCRSLLENTESISILWKRRACKNFAPGMVR
jgi:hypothetical protein